MKLIRNVLVGLFLLSGFAAGAQAHDPRVTFSLQLGSPVYVEPPSVYYTQPPVYYVPPVERRAVVIDDGYRNYDRREYRDYDEWHERRHWHRHHHHDNDD